jgi:hypothetical protein
VELKGGAMGRATFIKFGAKTAYFRQGPAHWHGLLRGCGAAIDFNFFQVPGLATHPHRHHCLAALRVDKPSASDSRE